jgi:hypothetical protein
MRDSVGGKKHSYQLVLAEDGRGSERRIEFEASGAAAALLLAQRQCGGRRAELFEDGRSLGGLQNRRNGGFWIISPPRDPAHRTG